MFKLCICIAELTLGMIAILSWPGGALASDNEISWQMWLQAQIQQHPQIIEAQKTRDAAFAQAQAAGQPLYNPELETLYEKNGDDDNYRLGLSQTIDLWDKRGARTLQGTYLSQAAQYNYQLVVQQKTAEVLNALITYQTSKDLAGFAQEQEEQMDALLILVTKRQQAGDLGQLDSGLAFLNLTKRLQATAQAKARFRQIKTQVAELLPEWSPEKSTIPVDFWQVQGKNLTSQEIERLPAVAGALAIQQALSQETALTRLKRKAEPTIGLNGGEDGDESVVALTLSIPLIVRNNYQDEERAANLQAQAALGRYQTLKRRYNFSAQAALATLQEYRQAMQRWQILSQGHSASTGKLAEQQWISGDMSTAEYLLTLDQRIEGMTAGIELRDQFQRACIDWLLVSGQLGKNDFFVKNNAE